MWNGNVLIHLARNLRFKSLIKKINQKKFSTWCWTLLKHSKKRSLNIDWTSQSWQSCRSIRRMHLNKGWSTGSDSNRLLIKPGWKLVLKPFLKNNKNEKILYFDFRYINSTTMKTKIVVPRLQDISLRPNDPKIYKLVKISNS